jgi:hypothetical protein
MNNCNHNKYLCDLCDKEYSNRQNLWRHKKTHINLNIPIDIINTTKLPRVPQKNETLPQNTTKIPQNTTYLLKTTNCKYCDKKLARYDSLKRHEAICKFKTIKQDKSDKNLEKENEELKDALKKQFEENNQIKLMLSELLNKNCKVHPKTLQKINKQLNIGDNGTINENINNGTVNNITYNIIGLGHENLTEVFSKKEKMAILKYRYYSLPQLVEYAHFNDKYPQFKNILITNTQNNLAYKYDTKKKQFVAVNKDELLDDIVDERMCDINSFYEELEKELDEKTKEILDKVKDKIENDPAYKEIKKKDIKLIIYNNRKKVSKESTKELDIEL